MLGQPLKFVCPVCECKLAPIDAMVEAIQIVTRKCKRNKCGTRWQIKLSPRKMTKLEGVIYIAEFVKITETVNA